MLLLMACFDAVAESVDYRFLSYNIRYDNPSDSLNNWNFRKEELADKVRRERPHIICIQEALLNQTEFLKSSWTAYGVYGVGREDGKLKGEMIPVFYDTMLFTCVGATTQWLSETPSAPSKGWDAACERVIAKLTLLEKASGDTLFVFNTHWDHVGVMARKKSSEMIYGMIEPLVSRKARVVLLGDFNAVPHDEAILQLTSLLIDTCPFKKRKQETFNGFGKGGIEKSHIDFIFITSQPPSRIRYAIGRWLTHDGRWLSDHHAIMASVRWKE